MTSDFYVALRHVKVVYKLIHVGDYFSALRKFYTWLILQIIILLTAEHLGRPTFMHVFDIRKRIAVDLLTHDVENAFVDRLYRNA